MFKRFKNAILILLAGTVGYVLRFWHEPNFSSVDYPKQPDRQSGVYAGQAKLSSTAAKTPPEKLVRLKPDWAARKQISALELNIIKEAAARLNDELSNQIWSRELVELVPLMELYAPRIEDFPDPYKADLWETMASSIAKQVTPNSTISELAHLTQFILKAPKNSLLSVKGLPAKFLTAIALAANTHGLKNEETVSAVAQAGELTKRIAQLEGAIYGVQLTNDPNTIIQNLKEISDPIKRQTAELYALQSLSRQNNKAAMEFFLSADSMCPRDENLLISLFGISIFDDPQGVSSQIKEAPTSPRKDWAILEMVDKISGSDFAAGLAWVGQISDISVRGEALDLLKKPRNYSTFKSDNEAININNLLQDNK